MEPTKSYLSGQKQKVFVNNTCTTYQHVITGVAQDSILGPFLHLFVCDMYFNVPICSVLYADDTNFICSSH